MKLHIRNLSNAEEDSKVIEASLGKFSSRLVIEVNGVFTVLSAVLLSIYLLRGAERKPALFLPNIVNVLFLCTKIIYDGLI